MILTVWRGKNQTNNQVTIFVFHSLKESIKILRKINRLYSIFRGVLLAWDCHWTVSPVEIKSIIHTYEHSSLKINANSKFSWLNLIIGSVLIPIFPFHFNHVAFKPRCHQDFVHHTSEYHGQFYSTPHSQKIKNANFQTCHPYTMEIHLNGYTFEQIAHKILGVRWRVTLFTKFDTMNYE